MPAYSMDLRERIVAAYQAGKGSVRALAVRFAVTPRSVSRYLALVRDTGSVAPREGHKRGARAKIDREALRRLWEDNADATEAELAALLLQETGVKVHRATIGRALLDMGLTRKKRASTRPSRTTSKSSPS
jgi:transposase